MSGRRVLVTGATSMIGAHLCRRLLARGDHVSAFVRRGGRRPRLDEIESGLSLIEGDLADPRDLAAAVEDTRPEVTFHLGASRFNPPGTPDALHFDLTARSTQALAAVLSRLPATRLIHAGSAAQYRLGRDLDESTPLEPCNAYGCAKAAAALVVEHYARHSRLEAVNLVLFTPYGPWEAANRLIPAVVLAALDGQPPRLRDRRPQRDFLFIDDAVEALLAAAEAPAPAPRINVCSGTARTVEAVAERVLHLMDCDLKPVFSPAETRGDEIWEISGRNGLARESLNWRPRVDFDDGLRASIDWVRANPELTRNLVPEASTA